MRERGLIYAFARKRVVHVGKRDNLRGNGNFVALKSVGIPAAVIAFVMPAANFLRHLQKWLVLLIGQLAQKIVPVSRVLFHDFKLFGRQPSGFIQNFIVDGDFADIVQRGRRRDQTNIVGRQFVFIGTP